MALTDKQQRFVEEYIVDLNATQAAIRAGYSEDTAYSIGHENLSKPEIAEAIALAKKERSDRTKIDADWLLKRLAAEVDADIADIYREGGTLKSVHEWPEVWRKGLVAGVDVHQEYTYVDGEKEPDGMVVKVRLSDRLKRLELIGKHIDVGAFVERIDHKGIEAPQIIVNRPNGD